MSLIQNKETKDLFYADDTTVIIELHPQEMELIRNLRTRFRFGEVTIIMQDGVPLRLKRVTEIEDLTKPKKGIY